MPQMQHADRVRSALADTWPDQTSMPAVPASAPSILPPASTAEPCRLTSQPLHGQGRCTQSRDARDKEPRALPQFRYCGRYPAELYNYRRPHQGRWCFGKTPMQTFLDTLPLAKEKLMAA